MSDWPTTAVDPLVTLTPWHPEAIGSLVGLTALTSLASAVYPTANLAIYVPVLVARPIVVTQLFCINGAAVSGNVDVGLYDQAGTRLVSAGSTAQSGTTAAQAFNVTDTLLGPGVFYLALACDNTTAAFLRGTVAQAVFLKAAGVAEQASAFALPATATLATSTGTYMPLFGLTTRSVL